MISPGFGSGLSLGMYCFTDSWRTCSCECAVARAYSLMCWPSTTCSLMSKTDEVDMMVR